MHRIMKSAIFTGSLLISSFVNAQQIPEFNPSDVIGMFAEIGTTGPLAGTKTVTEAHAICLAKGSIGSDLYSVQDGQYHDSYKICMAQYVPFRQAGLDNAGACLSQTVSWGQCQATFPASAQGSSSSVQNQKNTSMFEGFASFKCENGTPVFSGGGCSRAVKECAAGQIVNWGVTSPAWADESIGTVYKDKYGESIHTPKNRCYARMPYSTSGELHTAKPTTPEMIEPERYNMNSSASPQRCFDSKWLPEGNGGVNPPCEYIPKSCKAQPLDHNGCGFQLPDAEHDTIFTSNTPTPFASEGRVEAYCWDGEWKVKARSCNLSCAGTISPYNWTGSDIKVCQHNGLSQAARIGPGSQVVLNNLTDGMSGSVTYTCNNGNLTSTSEPCEPKSCSGLAAGAWTGNGKNCLHRPVAGNWSHNDNIVVSTETSILVASGARGYQCQYGNMIVTSESCDGGPVKCDNSGETPPIENCSNGAIVDGKCCTVVNGVTECKTTNDAGGENNTNINLLAELENQSFYAWGNAPGSASLGLIFNTNGTVTATGLRNAVSLRWDDNGSVSSADVEIKITLVSGDPLTRNDTAGNYVNLNTAITVGKTKSSDIGESVSDVRVSMRLKNEPTSERSVIIKLTVNRETR